MIHWVRIAFATFSAAAVLWLFVGFYGWFGFLGWKGVREGRTTNIVVGVVMTLLGFLVAGALWRTIAG